MHLYPAIVLLFLVSFAFQPLMALEVDSLKGEFVVKSFAAAQHPSNARVIESPNQLKLFGNSLTVHAEVLTQIPAHEIWQLGVIQQIDFIDIREVYSSSSYRWVLPKVPYCDSSRKYANDGQFWFADPITILGSYGSKIAVFSARDNPGLVCPWDDHPPRESGLQPKRDDLREVYKEYRFTDWLVAVRVSDHKLLLLRRFQWHFLAHTRVDPGQPIGHRSKMIPQETETPVVERPRATDLQTLTQTGVISAKQCGNRDQKLIWYFRQKQKHERSL